MKKCEDFELLINLALDGFLSEEEEAELQAHLKSCPACREKLAQLQSLCGALSALEEPVPAELHDRIMKAVSIEAAKSTPKVRKFPLRKVCSAIAAAAACMAIGVVALQFTPSLDMDFVAAESANNAPMAPEYSYDKSGDAADDGMPFFDTEFKPSQNVVQPNGSVQLPEAQAPSPAPMPADPNGQIAEDLPPLRSDQSATEGSLQNTAICKWLKVTGRKADMPEWVDWSSVYATELDGVSYDYLRIKVWAETVWLDHFSASGFTVEEMAGQELDPKGDCILLFFIWEQ